MTDKINILKSMISELSTAPIDYKSDIQIKDTDYKKPKSLQRSTLVSLQKQVSVIYPALVYHFIYNSIFVDSATSEKIIKKHTKDLYTINLDKDILIGNSSFRFYISPTCILTYVHVFYNRLDYEQFVATAVAAYDIVSTLFPITKLVNYSMANKDYSLLFESYHTYLNVISLQDLIDKYGVIDTVTYMRLYKKESEIYYKAWKEFESSMKGISIEKKMISEEK